MDSLQTIIAEPVASLIPGTLSLRINVPKSIVRPSIMPTPQVTTYAACELPNKILVEEYGTLVFVADEDGPPGYHTFLFVPVRTAAERETPIASLSYPTTQPHRWDDCLLQLGAIEDTTQPLSFESGGSVVEVPRLFGRHYLLPGGLYATEIDVEVYVSDVPFERDFFDLLTPVPTTISWQHRNLKGSLSCLHGLVEFPETQTSGTVLPGWGTVNTPLIQGQKQVFPPTNPPKWVPHVFDIQQRQQGGMWQLTKMRAYPPRGARAILNAAV